MSRFFRFAFLMILAPLVHASAPATFVTPHDTIPNFAQLPTIVSVQSGAWSSTATWSPARAPLPTDIVAIRHAVAIGDTAAIAAVVGVEAGGQLTFGTAASTRLMVGTLLVEPGGVLEVGTAAAPIPPAFTAEIVIRNTALAPSDTNQFGTGLICVNGRVTMHGAPRIPTFVRLASAANAGAQSFTLQTGVSGWQIGDKLVIPDSAQRLTETSGVPHSYNQEELTVTGVGGGGASVQTSPPLAFNHPATTDEDATGGPDFRPHLANLTRNVIVRSELRTGTRGHVFLTYKATIDIRYAAFVDLGRTRFDDLDPVTNHIGRYAVHLHHLYGPFPTVDPMYQFRLVGNAVYENAPSPPPQKWGIAIHDSHYGYIANNVVYNVGGAGIVFEDGSESYNVLEDNFVMRVLGNGARSEVDESGRGVAREGVGYWFRGTNNTVRRNVAANMIEGVNDVEAAYGFKYNMTFLGTVDVPNFRGADTSVAGQYTAREGNSLGILEFDANEMYGLIQGFTFWWLCTEDFVPVAGCPRSVIQDMVIWHTSRYAFYGYPSYNVEFNQARVYGDPSIASGNNFEFKSVFWFGDYGTTDLLFHSSKFYNTAGLNPPYFRDGFIRVEDNFFKTRGGVLHRKSGAPGSCPSCDLPDADTVLERNTFAAVGGQPLVTISLDDASTDPANNDRLIVCAHNGNAGDHFEVFFPSQGNAPCTTVRADVEGYSCVTSRAANVCGDGLFANGFE